MVLLAVPLAVAVVVVLEEEVLVCAVGAECHGRDSQPGEDVPEAVPPAELTGVAPRLAVVSC